MNSLKLEVNFFTEFFYLLCRNCEEKVFLVLEVLIDRAFGYVCLLGDLSNIRIMEIAIAEDGNCRFNDLFPS